MKRILLALLLLSFAAPAHALTGRVLWIVCDKPVGGTLGAGEIGVANIVARTQEVQGWKYETCMASDTAFTNSLYAPGYAFSATAGDTSTGSRYGRYDMAVILNMPAPTYIDTDADAVSQKVYHFCHWINRNHARAFPIPLFVPNSEPMVVTNKWAEAYTGCDSSIALATTIGRPYKDANGDSLYILAPNNQEEPIVFNTDSLDWVYPLFWRDVQGRIAEKKRVAHVWMTKGTGNHRVIWMPNATANNHIQMYPIIFAMFTKVQPIELPIIALGYGYTNIGGMETGADTLGQGAGLKAIKDYAVPNGMKIELGCYPYRMKSQAFATTSTAVDYATAFPDNIRLTMDSYQSWYPPSYYDMIGYSNTGSYSQKVKRIKYTQDSCSAFFPIIDTSRLDGFDGSFCNATTYDKADSILMAMANRGVTDYYSLSDPSRACVYPNGTMTQLPNPQRTWIEDGGALKELRIHARNHLSRYALQVSNSADSLKKGYIEFAPERLLRATFQSKYIPFTLGVFAYVGSTSSSVGSSANMVVLMAKAKYSSGIVLNAFTFCGGDSSKAWPNGTGGAPAHCDQAAEIRSNRSLFLDVMKQINAQKKMGDYLVATYGINGTTPFIFAWMDEVKWDRRNGRQFSNSHVRME